MTLPQTASRLVSQELKRKRQRRAPKKLPAQSHPPSATRASKKEERILSAINRAARIGEVSAFAFPLFGKISGVGVGIHRDGRALAEAIAMRKRGIPLPGCPVVKVELLAFPSTSSQTVMLREDSSQVLANGWVGGELRRNDLGAPVEGHRNHVVLGCVPEGAVVMRIDPHGAVVAPAV